MSDYAIEVLRKNKRMLTYDIKERKHYMIRGYVLKLNKEDKNKILELNQAIKILQKYDKPKIKIITDIEQIKQNIRNACKERKQNDK